MTFLAEKIEAARVWAVRCKGCGELYVARKIGAGETTHKDGFLKSANPKRPVSFRKVLHSSHTASHLLVFAFLM
jgi:hypothetical protein